MAARLTSARLSARLVDLARAVALLLFVAPLLLLVVGSFRPTGTAPPTTVDLVPDPQGFRNYALLLETPGFLRQAVNSLIVAGIAVPLGTLVASMAGFAIARLPRRDATVLLIGAVVAATLPPTSLFLGRLVVFRSLGLTDGPAPLIAPALIGVSPVLVLLFAWAYRTIPREMYDLARGFGLGPLATWRRVALPMRAGAAAAAAALAFIVTWGNLIDPLLYVYDERWFTLPLGIAALSELPPTDQGLMLAAAALVVAPVIVAILAARSGVLAATRSSAILASTLLVCSAVACTSEPEAPTEISVMVAGDPEEIEAYRAVVEGFNGSQDDVVADLIPFADRDDLIARLSTSIAGGEPPDLFLMNYRFYGQFAARGALEPVGPYLENGSLSADGFFETAMAPFRWDGVQTCLPQNVSSLVVYYNEDLFDAAGLSIPSDGWAWDDMVRAASRLTLDRDGDGAIDQYGLGVDPELIRLAPVIWSNGGTLVSGDPPTGFDFDGPALDALERFLALRSIHEVTPTDEEVESEDLETRFLRGSLGMLMESRRVVPTLRTIQDFGWDVAPFPALRDGSVSILHSDAYCMTAGSNAKDEAWRFLEFALGPEGQRIAAATGRTVPSLRSVAESDAFLDPSVSPAHSQVFLDQVPALRSVPAIATWPEIEDLANGVLEEAYYGGGRAVEVAIEITETTRARFAAE